jgi:hypothetical protein
VWITVVNIDSKAGADPIEKQKQISLKSWIPTKLNYNAVIVQIRSAMLSTLRNWLLGLNI